MIEFINVYKRYGQYLAVDNINLKIKKGEIFGFSGPNGAGKTSSIRMLTGIIPPSEGQILMGEQDIQKNDLYCKRITGYVPDRPYVYERLRAWEFIEFIAELYEVRSEKTFARACEYLELFDLLWAKDRLIEDFSHGMKQKLVIISALLHDPELLVIDEPMVGLDPKGVRVLKDLFVRLAKEGKTIFLSTHTMSVAQELCDRVAILNRGRVVALGSMDDLQKNQDENLEKIFLRLTEESLGSDTHS